MLGKYFKYFVNKLNGCTNDGNDSADTEGGYSHQGVHRDDKEPESRYVKEGTPCDSHKDCEKEDKKCVPALIFMNLKYDLNMIFTLYLTKL